MSDRMFFISLLIKVFRKHTHFDKLEFIALMGKGSTCEASIYFSRRDTDKIKSAKHDRREAAGFWRRNG